MEIMSLKIQEDLINRLSKEGYEIWLILNEERNPKHFERQKAEFNELTKIIDFVAKKEGLMSF
jgi:hypothetical protein